MALPIADTRKETHSLNGLRRLSSQISPLENQQEKLPDPQVNLRPVRRRLTAEYKLRILAQVEACTQPGQIGALLRREGLYSSNLNSFRKQRDSGKLGRDPHKTHQIRQEKEATRQREARKMARLEAENQKLKVLLELQKKVSELMQLALSTQPGL